MKLGYIAWAIIGMLGYSATTLFVKLAVRSGELRAFNVLAVATLIVVVVVWAVTLRGGLESWAAFRGANAGYAVLAGISLAIAVSSLFRALSLGPGSVVVPIYGMFIVGGSILCVLFLGEPVTMRKVAGLLIAVCGVYLIAG
jgi:transporter family protein